MNTFKSYITAVKFLLTLKNDVSEASYKEEFIQVGRKIRKMLIFRPTSNMGIKHGTVVILHGMSPKGPSDPRMIALCHSVASCGYQVICPEIQEVKDLTISSAQIRILKQVLISLRTSPVLKKEERFALMAPSFSAGVSLAALADHELQESIASMCALGTFASVKNVVKFFFSSKRADNYGRLIVMRNFIEKAVGKNPKLKKAFTIAIEDNWHNRQPGHLELYLQSLPIKDRNFFERIKADQAFRMQTMQRILSQDLDEFKKYDITTYAKDLNMPVLLVHGKDDHVIPASESMTMHQSLKQNSKESRLLITPFLSHGDTELSLKQLPALLKLVSGFAYFFRHAQN